MAGDGPETALAALRSEIDRIDEAMHRLLMERGEIIDRLIATKGTVASGSAFRPEREAAMMRVLAGRHRGLLPFDAPESIWRVIISTFTYVQAPYGVHADIGAGDAAMRDSARFHFGFTTPLVTHPEAASVILAVARSRGDLGLVAPGSAQGAWWRALEDPNGPKVIARLPFTDRPGHPAGTPILVVSKVPSSEGLGATRLYGASADGVSEGVLTAAGARSVATADGRVLIAAPCDLDPAAIESRLGSVRLVPVGSHPDPVVFGEAAQPA
ncbi:chorismate mutase [uncultured Enterovirga sp.]|uniref:chorismate mutase n=1 Tax=uncultured Enterovirga sp. TaxID=2026352 RepID=UPI0035CAAA84